MSPQKTHMCTNMFLISCLSEQDCFNKHWDKAFKMCPQLCVIVTPLSEFQMLLTFLHKVELHKALWPLLENKLPVGSFI